MTDCEAWNFLVAQYNKNLNCKEEIVQNSWDMIFSIIFGYSDSDKRSQYPVRMGSTNKYADFLIRHDGEESFVVELKRHTLHDGQSQLFSYLNQLKIDIGILVCDKLYIYDYDYNKRNENYSFVEISFTPDNLDGIKFIELFKSENIDKQKIKDFIVQKNQSKSNIASIKNEITQEKVVQVIKSYLTEKYPADDVEAVLAGYNITVSAKKTIFSVPSSPISISTSVSSNFFKASTKDNTQYTLNGANTGGKGSTVLAAVKCFVDSHPNVTLDRLQTVFPDEAAKPGFGKMIRPVEQVTDKQWGGSRFNRKTIILSDGTTIAVSTQWKPDNMQNFIRYAALAGLDIKPIC